MAILGNIIKGVIEVKGALTSKTDHCMAQELVLEGLLKKAADTVLGVHYGFEDILESGARAKAFSAAVPVMDYNAISSQWWHRQLTGEASVTWPGSPVCYALSSGTTGKSSKRIPVTSDMLEAIRQAGIKQVFSLGNYNLPPDFFEKEILMLGSSTQLEEKDGHLEGEISGISAGNIPFWFRAYYKPGEEIARLDDWDLRVAKIVENAPEWDVGALSGIPSWVELMLEKVIARYGLTTIHDIWPNLQVFTSGGVAFGPYEKSFNALMGRPVIVIDTYLASEGFLAFQARPETRAMQLITDNGIYFEFVPFRPEYIEEDGSVVTHAPSFGLDEVEEGQEYVLLISTVSGAWRYVIGDTVRFTDTERAEILITGRTRFFLNTVGSQLSVNKLDDTVRQLEDAFAIKIPEYTVCARKYDDGYYHSWYLGTDEPQDPDQLITAIDDYLRSANKNYRVARSKALKGVKARCISPEIFYEWNAFRKKKGGQVKMERVMSEQNFREWEDFVAARSS